MHDPLQIWRFTDGKRGHENQTEGLISALRQLTKIQERLFPVKSIRTGFRHWFRNQFPPGENLPPPDLLLGAGRLTHRPMIAAKRATKAKAVILMTPAPWFRNAFDLCLVPEHDGIRGSNIIQTQGALTAISPGNRHDPGRGLFLIGGPSAHHGWDHHRIIEIVTGIVTETPGVKWKLTTSRRTPAETTTRLKTLNHPNLTIIPAEKTDSHWVPEQLAESGFTWVTEDSVSMIYEALTSGTNTGILPVPHKKERSRVIHGLDSLITRKQVALFSKTTPLPKPEATLQEFNEAARCAKLTLETLFPHRLPK